MALRPPLSELLEPGEQGRYHHQHQQGRQPQPEGDGRCHGNQELGLQRGLEHQWQKAANGGQGGEQHRANPLNRCLIEGIGNTQTLLPLLVVEGYEDNRVIDHNAGQPEQAKQRQDGQLQPHHPVAQ